MTTPQLLLLIIGILLFQAMIWFLIIWWIKKKSRRLAQMIRKQCHMAESRIVIEPTAALYRGSDAEFGNIKGNGVICLTEHTLVFEKLTGQRIEINRTDIIDATVEDSFKGKLSTFTGGKHLVIMTRNGNRIGFLIRDAEQWVNKIKAL